jgi:hypothetical protein
MPLVGLRAMEGGADGRLAYCRQHSDSRQEQVYMNIERVFHDFQRTILDYPRLDVAWVPLSEPPPLTDAERVQQTIIFEMATSMFERAYLLYKDAPRSIRNRQWPGWEEYIRGYCAREPYRQWWRTTYRPEDSKNFYDTEFAKFMSRLLC